MSYKMPAPKSPQLDDPVADAPDPTNAMMNPSSGFEQRLARRMSFSNPRMYVTRDEFLEECANYFAFSDNEPIGKPVLNKRTGLTQYELKQRPYALSRLCTYLGIVRKHWDAYKKDETFTEVCLWAEQVIYDQKAEGGLTENMNAMLVARMLGLSDKTETKTDATVVDNTPLLDPDTVANLAHPDDPDPTGMDSGVFPRPLFSKQQLDAGLPFFLPGAS